MRSMNIGVETIAVTSSYSPPQAANESDFAQSLQEAVDMGSPSLGSKQPVQVRPRQHDQNTAEQPLQDASQVVPEQFVQIVPEQPVQDIPQQSVQVIPGQLVQDISEQPIQDIPQQPVQFIPEQFLQAIPEQPAVQEEAPQQIVDETQSEPQFQPQETVHIPTSVYPPELEQTDEAAEKTVQPAAAAEAEPESELMKELADLLGSKEEMLSAPQRMRKTLDNMIVQALSELSDPEKQEEEFTEMVLDFLMEYIDREFGGEKQETSVFSDTEDKDDNVQDVLLQTVVQMLENIRSEDTQTDSSEDTQAVEGIPSDSMAKEYVTTTANELLSEETRQMVEPENFTDSTAIQNTEGPQQKPRIDVSAEEAVSPQEKQTEEVSQKQPAEPVQQTELYQAAVQTAERIYTSVTRPQKPAEKEPVIRVDRFREIRVISPVKPAEELQELTSLVNAGVKSEQLDLSTDRMPIKPTVKLETLEEAIPFEAAVARNVPQITLTKAFEGAQRGAQQIANQIASEIFNQLPEKGGSTTFVMTLNPETLGKVTVKVVEEAGKISVSVTAHNKRTAELLSGRMDSLQTAMKENGTQLEKYQVVYAPEKDERPGQQQNFDGSSKNPYVKQDVEESEGDGEFAELLQNAV